MRSTRGWRATTFCCRSTPRRRISRGARHRLTLFLAQYWGGPTTYNDERGHPRLRMRHMPFTVGPLQRDRWLHHMGAAVAECAPTTEIAERLMALLRAGGRADAQRHRPADLVAGSAAQGVAGDRSCCRGVEGVDACLPSGCGLGACTLPVPRATVLRVRSRSRCTSARVIAIVPMSPASADGVSAQTVNPSSARRARSAGRSDAPRRWEADRLAHRHSQRSARQRIGAGVVEDHPVPARAPPRCARSSRC